MPAPLSPPSPILEQALPIELMNTIWADREGTHDALASGETAQRWIATIAPRLGSPVLEGSFELDESGLSHLRDLRDALRRIAAERTSDPRPSAASAMTALDTAIRTVNETARLAQVWPALAVTADGTITDAYEPAGPRDALLVSALATEGIDLFSRGAGIDLRACLAPGCVLYFIKEHPRREWCSVACGNRARAARHYARHSRRSAE